MKTIKLHLVLVAFLTLIASVARADLPKIKVLIIDGQNNHQWKTTTPLLKTILENASIFTVDVSTAPPGLPKVPPLPKNATPEQIATHTEAVKKAHDFEVAHLAVSAALWT
jgi:hypothetical protein